MIGETEYWNQRHTQLSMDLYELEKKKGLDKTLVDAGILKRLPEMADEIGIRTPAQFYGFWRRLVKEYTKKDELGIYVDVKEVNREISDYMKLREGEVSESLGKLIEVVENDYIIAYNKKDEALEKWAELVRNAV